MQFTTWSFKLEAERWWNSRGRNVHSCAFSCLQCSKSCQIGAVEHLSASHSWLKCVGSVKSREPLLAEYSPEDDLDVRQGKYLLARVLAVAILLAGPSHLSRAGREPFPN
ncbi:hypothetical protein FA13DRAFT_477248 [Coprinellus micaceus]|uniref:Uncharacterized protein n=1 Tax=Coprinellus micaceus TaxID=71717 RepID=A0A4Y7TBU3_COPMI|nr:hypothetical protein FA13DRAFT_477248 [Coprinellus micaceus]